MKEIRAFLWDVLEAVIILVVVVFLLFLVAGTARAHSWFDVACCHDKDCHPIKLEAIEFDPVRKVYRWTSSMTGNTYTIPATDISPIDSQPKVRKSQDGLPYGCERNVYENEPKKKPFWHSMCLYLPELY